MSGRTLVLVDGENLVQRYEATLASGEYVVTRGIDHEEKRYVWAHKIFRYGPYEPILRVSYFTTAVGSDEDIADLEEKLSTLSYQYRSSGSLQSGTLVPHVFKRLKNGTRNKSVDINLSVEALRHAYNRTIDQLVLLSGDGDFLPVMREVMRQGVKVYAGAFGNGLNPEIKRAVDSFIPLEHVFLEPKPKQ